MKKDYYEILGLSNSDKRLQGEDFTKVLKKAYRKLCLKYHPDKLTNESAEKRKDSEDKFKEITEAYSILSDENKRKKYDTFGTVDNNYSDFGNDIDIDIDEIFSHFGGFDRFERPFNYSKKNKVERGDDKKIRVSLTLQELYQGGKKEITFHLNRPCTYCGGSGIGQNGKYADCQYCEGQGYVVNIHRNVIGMTQEIHQCPHCGGSGKTIVNGCPHCGSSGIMDKAVTMTINIPYVTDCNKTLIKRGGGNAGKHNGINGDLYLTYNLVNDEKNGFYLSRENPYDIITSRTINIVDCLIGCKDNLRHIDGTLIEYDIKPCTNGGEYITIKGKGLPIPNGKRGDLKVLIKAKMPNKLSKEDIKLLNKLKKSTNFN